MTLRNMFCAQGDLKTEADVEALLVDRLLTKLRYPDNAIRRKHTLQPRRIPRGSKRERFRPDFQLHDRRDTPAIVLDAKAPSENPDSYRYQVAGYALLINSQHSTDNPVRYVAVTNGVKFTVWLWDNDAPLLSLLFSDFREDNPKFVQLRSLLAYGSLDIDRITAPVFKFERPDLNELTQIFKTCHNIIWKKEKLGPTDAFYEFAKLVFVKLREDRRVTEIINSGTTPTLQDFTFSMQWIEDQEAKGISDNPIQILFQRILTRLEEQIQAGHKKRIFLLEETLNMRADTVAQVVEMLQHLNLHGIDEDLNGRMFQSFLNATVRGKELGQFFTPRSVVKYMARAAALASQGDHLPVVLDGCCGSGGFLIEAMAVLLHSIDRRDDLTNRERDNLKRRLFRDHLYGIDAAEKIARIARLNMHLHGDGGSTVFTADGLDAEVRIPEGSRRELRAEISELYDRLVTGRLRFDVVLTNPPFSMKYERKKDDERRILDQYDIATTADGRPSASEKSNVLFLERYLKLLKPGGEILTVIDNTVLNGVQSQRYRDFLLKHFIVRQVVSLPFNTFFRAEANVQTSVLHLKKREEGEEQGRVFMAILNNVGHDDHQNDTPERDNTMALLDAYEDWRRQSKAPTVMEPNADDSENLGCPFQVFVVAPEQLDSKRLDAFYYSPELVEIHQVMRKREAEGVLRVRLGSEFEVVPRVSDSELHTYSGRVFRYFEIGDVTPSGAIIHHQEMVFDKLPTRARLRVKEGDILFARNNSSRGTTVLVPEEFDGQFVTTGFLAVRPQNRDEGFLLWAAMTSEEWRKQVYYLAVTAVQPEVREDIFRHQMLVPMPATSNAAAVLIEAAKKVHDLQSETWTQLQNVREIAAVAYRGRYGQRRQEEARGGWLTGN